MADDSRPQIIFDMTVLGRRFGALAVYERVAEVIRNTQQPVQLILDDTPVERRGKHIEGIGAHHSAKGLIKGHCAVTARVRNGGFELGRKVTLLIDSWYACRAILNRAIAYSGDSKRRFSSINSS